MFYAESHFPLFRAAGERRLPRKATVTFLNDRIGPKPTSPWLDRWTGRAFDYSWCNQNKTQKIRDNDLLRLSVVQILIWRTKVLI
jgi:hypothetical protein